jgi:flagellar hook-length control protein FliK
VEKIRAEVVSMIQAGPKAGSSKAAAGADAVFQKLLKERDSSSKDRAVSGDKSQKKPSDARKAEKKPAKADKKESDAQNAQEADSLEEGKTVPAEMLLQLQEMAGQTGAALLGEETISGMEQLTAMEAIAEIPETMAALDALPETMPAAGELQEPVLFADGEQTELLNGAVENIPESLTEMTQAKSAEVPTMQTAESESNIVREEISSLVPEEAREESQSTKAIAEAVKASRKEELPKEAKAESQSTKAIKVAVKETRVEAVEKQQAESASEKPVSLKQVIESQRSGFPEAGEGGLKPGALADSSLGGTGGGRLQAADGTVQQFFEGAGQLRTAGILGLEPAGSDQSSAIPVRTSEASLVNDVAQAMARKLPGSNGNMTIELEPAALGKLTIRVLYQAGKATVSILATNPRTQELLNMKATELASILEERTGQETLIYTDQPDKGLIYDEQQSEGERQRKENQGNQEQKEQKDQDSFLQQLRLGFI